MKVTYLLLMTALEDPAPLGQDGDFTLLYITWPNIEKAEGFTGEETNTGRRGDLPKVTY